MTDLSELGWIDFVDVASVAHLVGMQIDIRQRCENCEGFVAYDPDVDHVAVSIDTRMAGVWLMFTSSKGQDRDGIGAGGGWQVRLASDRASGLSGASASERAAIIQALAATGPDALAEMAVALDRAQANGVITSDQASAAVRDAWHHPSDLEAIAGLTAALQRRMGVATLNRLREIAGADKTPLWRVIERWDLINHDNERRASVLGKRAADRITELLAAGQDAFAQLHVAHGEALDDMAFLAGLTRHAAELDEQLRSRIARNICNVVVG